jgi:hypothetical protein
MLLLENHKHLMSDPNHQKEKIQDFANRRKKSLSERLGPVEKLIRTYCPLPITYDIGRLQLPYFNEYTYNDSMDAIYVSPQNTEVASIMSKRALEDEKNIRFDFNNSFDLGKNELNTYDKYNLNKSTIDFNKKVVFPPGSNLFFKLVSKENLYRLMHEDQEVSIKPHPLSNNDLLRKLGRDFGYHRLIDHNLSGYTILERADYVWGTTASEMPIRAALLGKHVLNIGNFFEEQIGSHMPINRLLWNYSGEEAKVRATRVLSSPLGGFFFPEDPNLEENIKLYFKETMALRDGFKPLLYTMPDHIKLEMWKKESN